MKSLLILLVTALYLYSDIPKVKASFNCALAKTEIEKLICSDINLGKKDMELSEVYHAIKRELPEDVRKHLYRSQIKWIFKERIKCLNKTSKVICLMDSYSSRTKKLRYLKQKLASVKSSNYKMIALVNRFDVAKLKSYSSVGIPAHEKTKNIGLGNIEKEFRKIKKSLKKHKSKTYPLNDISAEGGEVIVYKNVLRKIFFAQVTLFGETYKDVEEFYFKKGELVYGETRYYAYNAPMYTDTFDSKKTKKIVSKYYFKNSKLIKFVQDSKVISNKSSLKTKSDYLKSISDKVMKF